MIFLILALYSNIARRLLASKEYSSIDWRRLRISFPKHFRFSGFSIGPGLPTLQSLLRRSSALSLLNPQSRRMTKGPLTFEIVAECNTTRARAANMTLSHAMVDTPVFMPVGTQGTMKGLTNQQLEELDCRIILGNTYHLGLRPVCSIDSMLIRI